MMDTWTLCKRKEPLGVDSTNTPKNENNGFRSKSNLRLDDRSNLKGDMPRDPLSLHNIAPEMVMKVVAATTTPTTTIMSSRTWILEEVEQNIVVKS